MQRRRVHAIVDGVVKVASSYDAEGAAMVR